MSVRKWIVPGLCAAATLVPSADAGAAGRVFAAAGPAPKNIESAVADFRTAVGARRDVTWDDVPDELAEPATLPSAFYAGRGLIVRGSAGDQRVSMDGNTPADPDPDKRNFSDQQAGYAAQFEAFSKDRLFAPFGSTTTEFSFRTPAGEPAHTNGFGVVLTDVDAPGSRVVYLTPDGESLGSFDVPVSSGAGTLSFVGVTFDAGERIGRVRVIAGSDPIGAADVLGTTDIVALDDVAYGEPQATPPTPTLQFAADRIDAAERNGLVYVQVTRTGDLDRVSRVELTNEAGTATPGDDYVTASGTLTLPRGADRATAVIKLIRDSDPEPEESFTVALSAFRGAVIGEPSRATVVVGADPRGSSGTAAPAPSGPVRPVVRLRSARRIRLSRLLRKGLKVSLRSDRDAFAELRLSRGSQPAKERTVKLMAGRRRGLRVRLGRRARRIVRRSLGSLNLLAVVTDARNGTKVTAAREVRLLVR